MGEREGKESKGLSPLLVCQEMQFLKMEATAKSIHLSLQACYGLSSGGCPAL